MSKRYNFVSIKVDKNFFDNMFEPERKKLEMKLNKRISQPKFTEFLYRSGSKLWNPKMNFKKPKSSKWRFDITI